MKKLVKVFAVVLALLIAVVMVVPMALSGKIGDIVKREANAMLNAKVEFESLDISLLRHFPKASLELVDFSVTGVGEFEGQTLVAGERIEVAVDVMSIFGESFEISKVWLLSPKINGVVTKGGAVNWDIMKPTDAEAEVEVESVEEESATPGAVANHSRCGARAEHLIYVSLRALQSGQKGASSSQVKSVQDPDLLDIKHDPRTMAYEEDARKIRLR